MVQRCEGVRLHFPGKWRGLFVHFKRPSSSGLSKRWRRGRVEFKSPRAQRAPSRQRRQRAATYQAGSGSAGPAWHPLQFTLSRLGGMPNPRLIRRGETQVQRAPRARDCVPRRRVFSFTHPGKPRHRGPEHREGSSPVMRREATVKWFQRRQGIWLHSGRGRRRCLRHYSAIQAQGFKSLAEGDQVEFEGTKGPKDFKRRTSEGIQAQWVEPPVLTTWRPARRSRGPLSFVHPAAAKNSRTVPAAALPCRPLVRRAGPSGPVVPGPSRAPTTTCVWAGGDHHHRSP